MPSSLARIRMLVVPLLLLFTAPVLPAQELQRDIPAHRPGVPGIHGLVTTGGQPLAATAGLRTLMAGGNAADAAVSVLAALNVVQPEMTGAAGNAFLTYYDRSSGKVFSLNMTGATPLAIQPADMEPALLNAGIKAGITPGAFGGWIALLQRFGTRNLDELLAPAISYAADGHPLDPRVARAIANRRDFREHPSSARVFLPGGEPPVAGEKFKQEDLARTFRRLVEAEQAALAAGRSREQALQAAFDRFYTGDIAQEIAAFYREQGGLLSLRDLAAYQPIWAEPLHTTYRGFDVYTSPSTSRGGFEVAMQLNLMEGFDVGAMGPVSAELLHLQAEAIKVAKADIYRYVADPKFTTIPVEGMLSKEYAARRRSLMQPGRAMAFPEAGNPGGSAVPVSGSQREPAMSAAADRPLLPEPSWDGSTTSFSVVDAHGNVAVVTPTLGSLFGTGVVIGNTGLILNNGSRIGSTAPYPDNPNYPRGGQIPILNNSPTVVLRDGRFVLGIGSPGGETIGQTQFQAIMNVLDFGMGIQEAIETPRFSLSADPNFYRAGSAVSMRLENRVPESVVRALRAAGHQVELADPYSVGNMQGVTMDLRTGALYGGADPRSSGYAVGW